MALSKQEIDTIKTGVNKAKKKAMAFAFAKTRKDGGKDPLLEIDLKESMVKKAIKLNGAPPLMWGRIEMLDKQTMAFVVDKGKPKEIQQAIAKTLKKAHPMLGKARVLVPDEFEAQTQQSGGSEAGFKEWAADLNPKKDAKAVIAELKKGPGANSSKVIRMVEAYFPPTLMEMSNTEMKKSDKLLDTFRSTINKTLNDKFMTTLARKHKDPKAHEAKHWGHLFDNSFLFQKHAKTYRKACERLQTSDEGDEAKAAVKAPRALSSKQLRSSQKGQAMVFTCKGGKLRGVTKGMQAVLHCAKGTADSRKGEVVEIYDKVCRVSIPMPEGIDAFLVHFTDQDIIQVGTKAWSKARKASKSADEGEPSQGGLSPLEAAKEVYGEVRKIDRANQQRVEELVAEYAKKKAFRTYLRKKISTKLATRLGEELYMGAGSHIDTIYQHKCMTKTAWKAFLKPQQDAAGR